jgi:hypothetical protein
MEDNKKKSRLQIKILDKGKWLFYIGVALGVD